MADQVDVVVGDVTPDSVEAEYAAAVKEEVPEGGQVSPEGEGTGELPVSGEETPAAIPDPYKEKYENLKVAVKEARDEVKAEREKAIAERAALDARFNERLQLVLQGIQASQQPQETPTEIPNAEDDPIGYMQWRLAEQEKELAALKGKSEEQVQATKVQQQFAQFVGAVKQAEQEFMQTTPDYHDAYAFAKQARDKELQILGFTNAVNRRNIIQNEEIGISEQAFRDGVNPAQRIYEYAKNRGYKGPAPDPTPTPAPPAPAANLDAAKAKQAAAQSLGSLGSGTPASNLTVQQLLDMSDDEIAAITEKGGWNKILKY